MCELCQRKNLKKLVVVADAELDRTLDIPEALRRLSIIRTDMQAIGGMDREIYDLENGPIASMQPYLTKPFFMVAGDG